MTFSKMSCKIRQKNHGISSVKNKLDLKKKKLTAAGSVTDEHIACTIQFHHAYHNIKEKCNWLKKDKNQ